MNTESTGVDRLARLAMADAPTMAACRRDEQACPIRPQRSGLARSLAAAALTLFGAVGAQAAPPPAMQYQLTGISGGSFSGTPFSFTGSITTDGNYAANTAFDQSHVLSWALAVTDSAAHTTNYAGTGSDFSATVNGTTVNSMYSSGTTSLLLLSGRGTGELDFYQGGSLVLKEYVGVVSGTARDRYVTTALGTWDDNGYHQSVYTPTFASSGVAVTTPVPEPQTCAMLLAGLGVICFIGRRRQARPEAFGERTAALTA